MLQTGSRAFPGRRIAESELQNLHLHYNNVQIDSLVVMQIRHAIVAIDGEHCFLDFAATLPKLGFGCRSAGLYRDNSSYKAGVTRNCRALSEDVHLALASDHSRGDA